MTIKHQVVSFLQVKNYTRKIRCHTSMSQWLRNGAMCSILLTVLWASVYWLCLSVSWRWVLYFAPSWSVNKISYDILPKIWHASIGVISKHSRCIVVRYCTGNLATAAQFLSHHHILRATDEGSDSLKTKVLWIPRWVKYSGLIFPVITNRVHWFNIIFI